MPNHLKMSKVQSILALRQQGWSLTRIARELGIHRQTVSRYVRANSRSSKAPPGSESSKSTQAPPGSDDSKSTEAPRSSASDEVGRSACEPFREVIERKLDQGLHAKRIYQDLVGDHGYSGSYWSVMRFVRRLGQSRELPFRRMECEPGEDYGKWGVMFSVSAGTERSGFGPARSLHNSHKDSSHLQGPDHCVPHGGARSVLGVLSPTSLRPGSPRARLDGALPTAHRRFGSSLRDQHADGHGR